MWLLINFRGVFIALQLESFFEAGLGIKERLKTLDALKHSNGLFESDFGRKCLLILKCIFKNRAVHWKGNERVTLTIIGYRDLRRVCIFLCKL